MLVLNGVFPLSFQALTAELPQFLLTLLESPLEECDSPAAAKAQIVKALKSMETDLSNGEVVRTGVLVSGLVMLYMHA